MVNEINKRGQIAIWIVLSMVIVLSIIILLILSKKEDIEIPIGENSEIDVQKWVSKCIEDVAEKKIDSLLRVGGFETRNNIMHQDVNISYLCYNKGYYEPCINQHPMLIREFSEEVKRLTEEDVEQCFELLKDEIENNRNGKISYDELGLNYSFAPDKVLVQMSRKLSINENGLSRNYDDLSFDFRHPAYNLLYVASEIASQEAKYCYFEYLGYMVLHPRIKIELFKIREGNEIYKIIDSDSNKYMSVALRGCAIPSGLF
jgi:hypothetical protein